MNTSFRYFCALSFVIFVLGSACARNETININAPSPQPTRPAIDGRPKIVAYGDSLTAGFGLDSWEKAYPALLQKRLDGLGYGFQVLNYGQGGDTTETGLARLHLATAVANNKIFVVELGANDVMKEIPVGAISANLREILSRLRERRVDILLCGFEPPATVNETYRNDVAEMYRGLAAEFNVPLLANFMEGISGVPELMMPDNIHPNENGAKVIEENVFNAMRPLLEKYAPKN